MGNDGRLEKMDQVTQKGISQIIINHWLKLAASRCYKHQQTGTKITNSGIKNVTDHTAVICNTLSMRNYVCSLTSYSDFEIFPPNEMNRCRTQQSRQEE